jgi:hypothetical protein
VTIGTAYSYNGLNQLLGKTYSDSGSGNPTPWADYSSNKGWLTQAHSGASYYTYTGFDAIGRVTAANQTTGGTSYHFVMQYKPSVGVPSIQYPGSGRTVSGSATKAR